MADLREQLAAAGEPLNVMNAVTAQLGTALIPPAARCCCLCSIYMPHPCDGWRADGHSRQIPGAKLFGAQLPPVNVPLCASCDGVPLRQG